MIAAITKPLGIRGILKLITVRRMENGIYSLVHLSQPNQHPLIRAEVEITLNTFARAIQVR